MALINVKTRKSLVCHAPNLNGQIIIEIFDQWAKDPPHQDLGSEFNLNDFYKCLGRKNMSDYKTSYAAAIVDRFIHTIKDKPERYHKLNDTKYRIQIVKDIVEGYNNAT